MVKNLFTVFNEDFNCLRTADCALGPRVTVLSCLCGIIPADCAGADL